MAVAVLHPAARYGKAIVNQEFGIIDWIAPPRIIAKNEASILFEGADVRHRSWRIISRELFHYRDANFWTSRNLPESFSPRSGAGQPGTNSHRNVAKRCLAGMGFPGSKNYWEYGRPSDRNLDLYLLRDLPVLSVLWSLGLVRSRPWLQLGIRQCRRGNGKCASPRRSYFRLLRESVLRSILLLISRQGGHFCQWQGGVVSVPGTALELGKNSVAFCVRMNQYSGTPDQWLTAHFENSSARLKKRAS